ncbi:hypothetical protein ACFQL4_14935 [Halosimplex aquaticum]
MLAGAAPDRARAAVATLGAALSPGDDWRNFDRIDPVEAAIAVDPSVGTAAVADLAAAAQPWGIERGRAKALGALATVAESEPAAVADEAAAVAGLLTHRSERIRDAAATVVAAVGAETPESVPETLQSLAETDRGEDLWPMGVVARDAPAVAEAAVDASLSASHWDDEAIARLLAQVGRTNRDLATDGTDWIADLLWGSVEVQRIAPVVEALAPRDPSLAVRCVEPLAEHLTEGTPRWERGRRYGRSRPSPSTDRNRSASPPAARSTGRSSPSARTSTGSSTTTSTSCSPRPASAPEARPTSQTPNPTAARATPNRWTTSTRPRSGRPSTGIAGNGVEPA